MVSKKSLIELLGIPSVSLVTGGRGKGKTAFGMKILQEAHERDLNPCLIGLPNQKWGLLPDYITPVRSLDNVPDDASVFVDEAYLFAFARDHPRLLNKFLYKIVGISRQKNWTLVFATHTTRKLDVGIIIESDNIVMREPTWLHIKYERAGIRELMKSTLRFWSSKREPVKYAIIFNNKGGIPIEPQLPDFWSEELSNAFRGVSVSEIGEVE